MTEYSLFEPSLDITTPYLPYEDLGIQGVWPRNHKIPADIFPTFAHIGGTNVEKTKVHTASFTDDRRLRVDTGSGGGGGNTGWGATRSVSGNWSATQFYYENHANLMGDLPSVIWRIRLQLMVDGSTIDDDFPSYSHNYIQSSPHGGSYDLGYMMFPSLPNIPSQRGSYAIEQVFDYPGGWANPGFINPSDSHLVVSFQSESGAFFNAGSAMIEVS